MTVKIGIQLSPQPFWRHEFAHSELHRIGLGSMFLQVDNPSEAILRGEVDVAIQALSELPLVHPEGLVITAVSARKHPADLLVMRPEAKDGTQDFALKHGSSVAVASSWQAAQLRDFRPDLHISVVREGCMALLACLQAGGDAAVFAVADFAPAGLELSDLEVLELNPREFVPPAGQGVLAWLAHRDDLTVRRILKQVHHPEVSACTNVERRVLELLGGGAESLLGAFVERDAAGNFHAFAACAHEGRVRRVRLSQSTNVELAERVAGRLG